MRQFPFAYLIFWAVLLLQKKNNDYSYDIDLRDEKSEFGLEDLAGRLEYERLLTANPKTGEIPQNIQEAELAFSKTLGVLTVGVRRQELEIISAGPFNVGGRTRAVAIDIRDENIILAGGVSGGIWKSIDGGATWKRTSNPENRNSVTCLVQDTRHGKEDTWYHGTGEIIANSASGGNAPFRGNGIYKSEDNGETWNVIPSTVDSDPSVFNSQFQYIWNIVVNDKNLLEDEILVATFGGILRSVDGGDHWIAEIGRQLFNIPDELDLNSSNVSFFTDVEITSDGIFYASLSSFSRMDISPNGGIFISKNADDWFPITPFSSNSQFRRIVIGHAPSNPRQCYFLVDANPTFLLRYDLRRFGVDGPFGLWTNLSDYIPAFGGELGDFNSQGSYNMVVEVHPQDESLVFIGGRNLYRSTDGFTSSDNTTWIGGYHPEGGAKSYPGHHPDQHAITFFSSDPDKMLSASDGGLRLGRNLKDSVIWQSRNSGYLTSQFFTVALSKEADNFILGGMQDNGTDISPGSDNWSGILGGDGSYVATTPGKVAWFSSFQSGKTFRLTLNKDLRLTSFARVDPAGLVTRANSIYLFINPFVIDPVNSSRMFIAGGNYLYVNENVFQIPGGSQEATDLGWKRVEESFVDKGLISSMDISKDGSTFYFGCTNGTLFRMENANDYVAMQTENITNASFPQGYISSISVDPEDATHIMIVFSNYEIPSVFESIDGGVSFTDISGNLEQFPDGTGNGPSVRWCELIPTNSGMLYLVGTSTGLYSANVSKGIPASWIKESADVVGSAVVSMMDYRPLDGKLAIATHGNGVFTTTVNDFKQIEQVSAGEDFNLIAAYPNPFNVSTRIQYSIPESGTVKIDMYSLKGEYINNLIWAPQFAGVNTTVWDGTNASGSNVSNGIYLCRIEYNGTVKTGRLSLRK